MEQRAREAGREAVDPLDRAAHEVVAERDLAVELARVGQVDRGRVLRVGLDLADVVDQRSGHGEVAVDAREAGGDRAHGLADRERVLEQPVAVGLVVELRRRRARGSAARSRSASPKSSSSSTPQVRVLNRLDQAAKVGLHLAGLERRRLHEVGERVVALCRGASA